MAANLDPGESFCYKRKVNFFLNSSEDEVVSLLPFFMVLAAYCYYEKVRRTMRTTIVSYLLKWNYTFLSKKDDLKKRLLGREWA